MEKPTILRTIYEGTEYGLYEGPDYDLYLMPIARDCHTPIHASSLYEWAQDHVNEHGLDVYDVINSIRCGDLEDEMRDHMDWLIDEAQAEMINLIEDELPDVNGRSIIDMANDLLSHGIDVHTARSYLEIGAFSSDAIIDLALGDVDPDDASTRVLDGPCRGTIGYLLSNGDIDIEDVSGIVRRGGYIHDQEDE